jgi:hypothetical protein
LCLESGEAVLLSGTEIRGGGSQETRVLGVIIGLTCFGINSGIEIRGGGSQEARVLGVIIGLTCFGING